MSKFFFLLALFALLSQSKNEVNPIVKLTLTRFIHTLVYFDEKSLNIFTLDFCGNI